MTKTEPKKISDLVAINRVRKVLAQLPDATAERVLGFVVRERQDAKQAAYEGKLMALRGSHPDAFADSAEMPAATATMNGR